MNVQGASQMSWYGEGLLLVAALGVALFLYFLIREFIRRRLVIYKKGLGLFLIRIALPVVFILVALCLKLPAIKEALRVSQRFSLVLEAALIFFIVVFVIRLLDISFHAWYSRRKLPFPLPRVLHGLIQIIIYLALFFSVLKGVLGINITPFLTTSAIFTAILGLALQGVLSNILSGVSLRLTKSFNTGDWIQVNKYEGVVLDTNWRETRILDRFANVIVIPNTTMASEMITNMSLPDTASYVGIPVKASYAAPPLTVINTLLETTREVPEVLKSPPPRARILAYEDLGISYLLSFAVSDLNRKNIIYGEVARLIWYKFKRNNIEIPVAVGEKVADVLKVLAPKEKALAAEEGDERAYQALLHSSFLRYPEGPMAGQLLVPEEEVRALASSVRKERYAPREVLFSQGEKGENCYVVAGGKIKGEIVYEEDGKKYISEFNVGPGGLFGEMSLFTGTPRTATGIIEEESELLNINAASFAGILARNPHLSETIAELVSERNKKNEDFLKKIKGLSANDLKQSTNKKSVLERLRSFVRLFRKS